MIARNENALECDFAETYPIYDYRELQPKRAALFAAGLPIDSRIKRELSGQKHTVETILLSHIADSLQTLVWFKTKDGQRVATDTLVYSESEIRRVAIRLMLRMMPKAMLMQRKAEVP